MEYLFLFSAYLNHQTTGGVSMYAILNLLPYSKRSRRLTNFFGSGMPHPFSFFMLQFCINLIYHPAELQNRWSFCIEFCHTLLDDCCLSEVGKTNQWHFACKFCSPRC